MSSRVFLPVNYLACCEPGCHRTFLQFCSRLARHPTPVHVRSFQAATAFSCPLNGRSCSPPPSRREPAPRRWSPPDDTPWVPPGAATWPPPSDLREDVYLFLFFPGASGFLPPFELKSFLRISEAQVEGWIFCVLLTFRSNAPLAALSINFCHLILPARAVICFLL